MKIGQISVTSAAMLKNKMLKMRVADLSENMLERSFFLFVCKEFLNIENVESCMKSSFGGKNRLFKSLLKTAFLKKIRNFLFFGLNLQKFVPFFNTFHAVENYLQIAEILYK